MTAQLDQRDLVDRATRLVEAAKRAGADAADAVSVRRVSLGVDVRLGKVEETTRAETDDFTLRVFVGKRSASVSANVFGDPAEFAARAVAMAKVTPEDPNAGLADPARLAKNLPDLDLLDETIPTPEELTEVARAAEDAARAVPGVTNSGGGGASWSLLGLVLATSDGFAGSYLTSRFANSVMAIAGEGTGMERDYDTALKTHRSDMPSPEDIGRSAGQRAIRRLNPGKMETTRLTVVYEPRAASSLLGHLAGAINGTAIARRTSFLGKALGTEVFSRDIRIVDDPHRPRALGSRPFDGEGVAAEAIDVIRDGVLTGWLLDSTTGRELGIASNGRAARMGGGPTPSTTNFNLQPGRLTPGQLVAEVKDGLFVTDLIGAGVSTVTGDYSRGVSGFRIRNGELEEAVSEITVASNLREMFRSLRAANDLEYRFNTNSPTVAVEGMTVAGR